MEAPKENVKIINVTDLCPACRDKVQTKVMNKYLSSIQTDKAEADRLLCDKCKELC